jgi:hypothetical protein
MHTPWGDGTLLHCVGHWTTGGGEVITFCVKNQALSLGGFISPYSTYRKKYRYQPEVGEVGGQAKKICLRCIEK